MEWIKNMRLRKSFLLLSVIGAAAALLMICAVFWASSRITKHYPTGGVVIDSDGVVTELAGPTPRQARILDFLGYLEIFVCITFPICGLGAASALFYRWKLKEPIAVLRAGAERIREHDLDFTVPAVSGDELGQVCATFETMREELLATNRELWRQAEERKRLNAAFSHDLRNPVTVLKGTVKMMRQGVADEHALERLETYVVRIDRYVEAMSGIQRLEQMPVQKKETECAPLRAELEDTAKLLISSGQMICDVGYGVPADMTEQDIWMRWEAAVLPETESVALDHGLFLTVAENLIGNAARYARRSIQVNVILCGNAARRPDVRGDRACASGGSDAGRGKSLVLIVADDGGGYPVELMRNGPKPFGRMAEDIAHFGMGLYTSRMMCVRHGGELLLENRESGGARAVAVF